ncbi:hypothetical protein HHI36_008305 [Cryptolaemus montrouzieri]|uniref:Uncharacterized protein n=1 Tax=Cryptolaemus montrouzieri TaxID=559131 RepID=A0ABD2MS27_9CUCU
MSRDKCALKGMMTKNYETKYVRTELPILISPKFYSKNQEEHVDSEKIERIKRSLETVSPNEQFEKPLTENQKYGWYNVKFSNLTPSDPNLDFRFKRNQFVFEHLMNYAKIRE